MAGRNRLRKFQTIDQVQAFLNGGVQGGPLRNTSGGGSQYQVGTGVTGLVGKTLILKAPGPTGTVTFVASTPSSTGNPDPNTLLLSDIVAQITAVIPTVVVNMLDGLLLISEVTPTNGVSIDKNGTANPILGFDDGQDTVGRFYLPIGAATPPVAPYWVWADATSDNMHLVYTVE